MSFTFPVEGFYRSNFFNAEYVADISKDKKVLEATPHSNMRKCVFAISVIALVFFTLLINLQLGALFLVTFILPILLIEPPKPGEKYNSYFDDWPLLMLPFMLMNPSSGLMSEKNLSKL